MPDTGYFNSKPSTWDIAKFLDACPLEPFELKIDSYIKSLGGIISDDKGERHRKAESLLNSYRQVCKHALRGRMRGADNGVGRDGTRAREWYNQQKRPKATSIYVNNSTGVAIGTSSQVSVTNPRKRKRKSGSRSKIHRVDTESIPSSSDIDCTNEEGVVAESKTKSSFVETYKKMDPSLQWVLSSGTVVERVIFQHYQKQETESLAHSWVIDVLDNTISDLFDPDDWDEICSHIPDWPEHDEVMVGSMVRFAGLDTPTDLRRVLNTTSYLAADEIYSREKHYDAEWVDLVLRKLVTLYEGPDQLLLKANLEGWYDSNIWSLIVDHCLHDLTGMLTVRKESTCRATTMRKNRDRTKTGRQNRSKIGRRLDAIIKDDGDHSYEYGAIEVANKFEGETSTKWLTDKFKLAKALHDMLSRLHRLVSHEESIAQKLQVVGLLNSGLKCQVLRVTYAKGYLCLLSHDDLKELPPTVKGLEDFFELLLSVWRMKKLIRDCKATVDSRHEGKTQTDLFKKLMKHRPKRSTAVTILPMSCDTE